MRGLAGWGQVGPSRRGNAGLGAAGPGEAWQGVAVKAWPSRLGRVGQGVAGQGVAVEARPGAAGRGQLRPSRPSRPSWHVMAGLGAARRGWAL